ncbi:hypothetical protein CARUB_v100274541mg, partial [Capsella rubella]
CTSICEQKPIKATATASPPDVQSK